MAAVVQKRRAGVVEVRVGVPAGTHLLDRQVEDLGIESPPRGRRHGSSRFLERGLFELKTPVERRLRDLELLRARLARAEAVLQLVARLGEGAGDRVRRGGAPSSRRSPSRRRGRRARPQPSRPGGSARGRARRRCCRPPSSGASGRRGATRSARAPSAAPHRARRCRSRCAPRRGRRRARRRAARTRPGRARAGSSTSSRAAGWRLERRRPWSTTALPTIGAEHARALDRQLRLGQRPLDLWEERERPRRASPGRAGADS